MLKSNVLDCQYRISLLFAQALENRLYIIIILYIYYINNCYGTVLVWAGILWPSPTPMVPRTHPTAMPPLWL